MKPNSLKSIAFAVVCLILGVLIALQMKNVNSDNITEGNLADLQAEVIEYAKKNNELSARNAELYEFISLLENDEAASNDKVKAIIEEKERYAIFAGLREVSNFGIEIQVSCAEGIPVDAGVLRSIVNELRGLGAQAIAVKDERIVAMSEIRASNTDIIINGNAFSAFGSFKIKAITDPASESYDLEYLRSVCGELVKNDRLQTAMYVFQVSSVPELTIPALSDSAFKLDLLMPTEDD